MLKMNEKNINKLIEEIFFIFDLAIYRTHKKEQIKALLKNKLKGGLNVKMWFEWILKK